MQIKLTPEQEAQLSEVAAGEGKTVEDIAQELFSRGLQAEFDFVSAVRRGMEAASKGDFVDSAEVWAMVERSLARS